MAKTYFGIFNKSTCKFAISMLIDVITDIWEFSILKPKVVFKIPAKDVNAPLGTAFSNAHNPANQNYVSWLILEPYTREVN